MNDLEIISETIMLSRIITIVMLPVLILLLRASLTGSGIEKMWTRRAKEQKLLRRTRDPQKAIGIVFGKDALGRIVYAPPESEYHCGVFAPTGGGKTWAFLLNAVNAMARMPLGGYVPDVSGDIAPNILAADRIVYSPEKKGTMIYNVFGLIDSESSDREKNRMLEELALIFFPDIEFKNGSERYFYEGGRDILIASLTAFYFTGMDFPDICRKIKNSSYNDLFSDIVATGNEKAIGLLQQFRDQKEVDIGGCKGQATNAINLFAKDDYMHASNLGRPPRSEMGFSADIVNSKLLVLDIPRPLREIYVPLNKLITKQVMQVTDRRRIRQLPYCLIALDELSTLLKGSASVEDQLINAMQNIRKYNGRIIYLTQSIKDLDTYIGENKRSVLIDNTGFIVAMGAFDSTTRRFFSELVSTPSAVPDTEHAGIHQALRRRTVQPDDFADLPDDKLYVIWRGGYLCLRKIYFFNDHRFKEMQQAERLKSRPVPDWMKP